MAHPLIGQEYVTTKDDAKADSIVPTRIEDGDVFFDAFKGDDFSEHRMGRGQFSQRIKDGDLKHA